VKVASIIDYRDLARRRLPRFLFDYIDGGSYGERTLRANVADLTDIALRRRILRDVSAIDPSTELFGQPMALTGVTRVADIDRNVLVGLAARER
jgi:L-lactate dehydrogenase (cytochrome)